MQKAKGSTLMEQIMQALIDNVIVPLLAIAGTALMAYVTNLVNTKIKSEKIKNAYAAIAEQAFSVVNGLQEVVVKDLKAAAVDGKLTADEIGQIKCDAINQIKATVTGRVTCRAFVANGVSGLNAVASTYDEFIKVL